ncbi:protein pygopus-like [Rhagoletis pomonella]|uniref:protein pygopus-like n=1 Tax=Rhagoletis pomonella TaxID=28610 RepID=UPI0017872AE9|nr:protein pygopus-like [Rhagoletis pomonella]
MVNNGGNDTVRPSAAGQRALYKALERAADAQRRLNEAISCVSAGAGNSATSSSDSEGEDAAIGGCTAVDRQRRSKDGGCRERSHPYHHFSRMGHHGAHGKRAAMSGFPSGRHMKGFPGFGAFPGMMSHGMGPHPHSHPHPHPHPHPPHHHHHHDHHGHGHGHFGGAHPFGGWAGRRGGFGHGFGPAMGPFGSGIHQFGMRHGGGHRQRAHSFPGL